MQAESDPSPQPQNPGLDPVPRSTPALSGFAARIVALVEVILCSDYVTQFTLAMLFASIGIQPVGADHRLHLSYVVLLSLLDTAALLSLILLFLHAHGEAPRRVFLGSRRIGREAGLGVALIFAALAIGMSVLIAAQHYLPWLHTVARNPLQDLIRSERDAWVFALVVVVAGGVREEIQRAFLLLRFEQSLGGAAVGVLVTSVAFGAGHFVQGHDAGLATGILGAFWAVIYLLRRSIVAPMISHAGFDLLEIVAGRMTP